MISDQELNKLEESRQGDSDWVMEKLGLIAILQKYGDVKIAGAKALGLMVAKDIDISVVVNETKVADWQKLVNELMVTPNVRNISMIDDYYYNDQNQYDPKNGKKYSLYVSINNILGPEGDKFETWECQIHLIEAKVFDEIKISGVKNKLNPEKRLTILRLKYWANKVNGILKLATNGNFKILSPAIYEAVLDNNIDSIEDFVDYFRPTIPERFQLAFGVAVKQKL